MIWILLGTNGHGQKKNMSHHCAFKFKAMLENTLKRVFLFPFEPTNLTF